MNFVSISGSLYAESHNFATQRIFVDTKLPGCFDPFPIVSLKRLQNTDACSFKKSSNAFIF